MANKKEAVKLIEDKLNNKTFLTYKEIAEITGYHPKYILKLKKEVIDGTISLEHGNKNRVPANVMSEEEKEKIMLVFENFVTSIIGVVIHVFTIYLKKMA